MYGGVAVSALGCPDPFAEVPAHPCTLLADGPLTTTLRRAVRVGQRKGSRQRLRDALDRLPPAPTGDLLPGESSGASAFVGAPALAAVLRVATTNAPDDIAADYRQRFEEADARLDLIVRDRLWAAYRRLDERTGPARAEFSVREGLAGLGLCLLQRPGPDPLLANVVECFVELVLSGRGEPRPGWWVHDSPCHDLSERKEWPHGHADLSLPDGSAGILALLALARSQGVSVYGLDVAMRTVVEWYRAHQRTDETGYAWWPDVVTDPEPDSAPELHLRQANHSAPGWCGTLGIARSLQLAGIALGDDELCETAVDAACTALMRDTHEFFWGGLCHGPQGAALIAKRMFRDAGGPFSDAAVGELRTALDWKALPTTPRGGLLDGAVGVQVSQTPDKSETVLPSPGTAQWDSLLGVAAPRPASRAVPARPLLGESA
ncbi:lanthionine synthetase LanC family protein [Amycolatopsis sp. NPDC004079]|uniref:lanthionine synthetase LanC family protein n=1 Tax=Amycolatopsis sp. NPDC004079 TaxID=3154549 RepID=UPI0033A23E51